MANTNGQPWLHRLSPLLMLVLFAGALWFFHRELEHYRLADLKHALAELPAARIAAALLLTCLSYVTLTGYDTLAVRYIGQRLPYRRVAFAAFEGFAFSQNFALAGLTGASVRYRLYSGWGLSAAQVAALVVFNGLSFWLGLLTVGGVALLLAPAVLHFPLAALRAAGALFLALVSVLFVINASRRRPWKIARWEFHPPRPGIVLGQIGVAMIDWSLAAAVLYVLLPQGTISYQSFVGTFLLAQLLGILSHVPGGLGVFETVLLTSLSPHAPASSILAALVMFRVVYYLVPLLAAAALLAGNEVRRRKLRLSVLAPPVLAAAVFLAGTVLLISGATPAEAGRMRELSRLVPLPLVELSHFMGSVVGVLLLLLARGLQRLQRASFVVATGLIAAAIGFSLLKGLDYEEASLLAVVLVALLFSREAFYRRASLIDERFTARWAVSIFVVLAGTAWLAFFAHKHVGYSSDLWWRFEFQADAPRALRAGVGAMVVLVLAAGLRLLRPPGPPSVTVALERVRPIVEHERSTTAFLALLGDKRFLFSDSGSSALMYGASGRSWISLGDPFGAENEKRELIWAFRELADRNGSWPAFYEVGADQSDTYRQLGLGQFKIGEQARVLLPGFTLKGGARASLRGAHHHGQREGLTFEVIPREGTGALLPELAQISNEWLRSKRTREKGFSLGFFDERYLRSFPMAIVRRSGVPAAFANVLEGAEKEELSIDLMRHRESAPSGVMDYLFVELILWGRDAGYQWFNLGMAPLAGFDSGPLAPLWDRAGAFLFRHGEHFYNFEGLRSFKAKFAPVWSPRYLACPGGIALPFILTDIAALISGGVSGVVARSGHRRRLPHLSPSPSGPFGRG